MGRLILSVALCSATLLGPLRCCCTLAPLVEAIAKNFSSGPNKDAKPPANSCCRSHAPVEPKKDRPTPPCPCKHDGGVKQPVISVGNSSAQQLIADLAFSTNAFEHFFACLPTHFPSTRFERTTESVSFPYMTGPDILRALHIHQI